MVKKNLTLPTLLVFLAVFSATIPVSFIHAEEADFSCMEEQVLAKTQVSKNYREYDIVLRNRCSEPVYWSMCIERMNPWTNEIMETLTPSAWVDRDKKFRINLQMKKQMEDARESYQEFYVNLVFDLHSPPKVDCVAYPCETKKRGLRSELRSNSKALEKVRSAMKEQISAECVRTGWSRAEKESCQARVSAEYRPELSELGLKENAIQAKLSAIDPEICQIHPGNDG